MSLKSAITIIAIKERGSRNFARFACSALTIIIITGFLLPFLSSCSQPSLFFEEIIISEDIQKETNIAVIPKNEFDENTKKIFATVKYSRARGSDVWGFKWTNTENNMVVFDKSAAYKESQPDSYFSGIVSSDIYVTDDAQFMYPGTYIVEFYHNGELVKTASFNILKPVMKIREIFTSKEIDENGVPLDISGQFYQDETVYICIRTEYLVSGNSFKAVLKDSSQNVLKDTALLLENDYYEPSYIWFGFEPFSQAYEIKPGSYEVEIYLNDKLSKTAVFEIIEKPPVSFKKGDIYENEPYGFKIVIPDGWVYSEVKEEEAYIIDLSPGKEIPAAFIFIAAAAPPIKPYEDFIKSDAEENAMQNNWILIDSKSRHYNLNNFYPTLEVLFLYRDDSANNYAVAYSITEYKNNAYIFYAIAHEEEYGDAAQIIYFEILNSLEIK